MRKPYPPSPLSSPRSRHRLSRRWSRGLALLFAIVLLAAQACSGGSSSGSSPTAPAPQCLSVGGTWNVEVFDSCNESREAVVTIAQASCTLQFATPLMGEAEGSIRDSRTAEYQEEADLEIEPPAACGGGPSAGVLRITSENEMFMQWGTGDGCCRHGAATFER